MYKKRIINFFGIFSILLISYVQIDFISNDEAGLNFFQLSLLRNASAETTSTYKTKKTTTEYEYHKVDENTTESRSRSKTDCDGSGNVVCTPTEWTEWSEWS